MKKILFTILLRLPYIFSKYTSIAWTEIRMQLNRKLKMYFLLLTQGDYSSSKMKSDVVKSRLADEVCSFANT